jgi:small redox-active disulfide protein 2
MDIKILGSGCRNCQNLEANTRHALDELGLEARIEHVRDDIEILSWGVMSTPALVVNDQVVVAGRVPSPGQVRDLIAAADAAD